MFVIKLDTFIKQIPNSKFIIELTKCCGYSEFITIYKNQTLADLYNNVSLEMQNKVDLLYVIDMKTNEKVILENTSNVIIRNYIQNNAYLFKPVYPFPHQIVYRIYYRDNCSCLENNNNNSKMNIKI